MALATYAHVLTTATSNQFGTTEFNVFDEDNYSSYTKEVTTNGITYNSSTGEFTVGSTGTYYIIVALQTLVGTNISGASVTWRIKLNGSEVAGGTFLPTPSGSGTGLYGPEEDTFQTVIDATSGQSITVTIQDNSGSDHNLTAQKNSSIFIYKVENDYGLLTRTANSTGTVDPYNVYATSSGGSVVFESGSGAIVEDASGNGILKFTENKPALLMHNGFYDGSGNPDVSTELDVNGFVVNTYTGRKRSDEEPREISIFSAYGFSTNDKATIKSDTNFQANFAASGSSAAAIGLHPTNNFSWRTVKSNSNVASAGSEFNIYATGSYSSFSSFGYNTGSSYDSDSGQVTIARDGDYVIFSSNYFECSADTDISFKVKKNGSEVNNILFHIDTYTEPAERSCITLLSSASAGDTVQFFASGTAGNIQTNAGTTFVVVELLADDPPIPPGPPSFNQGSAGSLISDDFTINTFAQNTLSVQYDRSGTAQVPFILGGPGPLRIRGKTTAQVIKPGDKKN